MHRLQLQLVWLRVPVCKEQCLNAKLTATPVLCRVLCVFVVLSVQAEVTALEQQLYSIAGHPFNLNSPKDCSKVIYEELALKGKGIKKTKSGYLSTSM